MKIYHLILILFATHNIFSQNVKIGTFKDSCDGTNYKWVKIGEQTWMSENLNFSAQNGSWCYNEKYDLCYNSLVDYLENLGFSVNLNPLYPCMWIGININDFKKVSAKIVSPK